MVEVPPDAQGDHGRNERPERDRMILDVRAVEFCSAQLSNRRKAGAAFFIAMPHKEPNKLGQPPRRIFPIQTVKDVPGHFVNHVVGLDTKAGLNLPPAYRLGNWRR